LVRIPGFGMWAIFRKRRSNIHIPAYVASLGLVGILQPRTISMMEYELIKLFTGLFGKLFDAIEMKLTRKRDAKRFLKKGMLLLAKGCSYEADIQFNLALMLCPDIVNSLSQSEQRRFIEELDTLGRRPNATRLKLLIENKQRQSSIE
jgi:hypothetical protein